MKEKTPLMHKFVYLQMQRLQWEITSFSKTILLQREPYLHCFILTNSSSLLVNNFLCYQYQIFWVKTKVSPVLISIPDTQWNIKQITNCSLSQAQQWAEKPNLFWWRPFWFITADNEKYRNDIICLVPGQNAGNGFTAAYIGMADAHSCSIIGPVLLYDATYTCTCMA